MCRRLTQWATRHAPAPQIFGCTPEMLASEVRSELQGMLGFGPLLLEGSIRPGCLHLLVNVMEVRGCQWSGGTPAWLAPQPGWHGRPAPLSRGAQAS